MKRKNAKSAIIKLNKIEKEGESQMTLKQRGIKMLQAMSLVFVGVAVLCNNNVYAQLPLSGQNGLVMYDHYSEQIGHQTQIIEQKLAINNKRNSAWVVESKLDEQVQLAVSEGASQGFGMKTVSELFSQVSEGVPIAAINADFYNMITGESVGLVVQNGEITHTQQEKNAIGVKADGEVVIGEYSHELSFQVGEHIQAFQQINTDVPAGQIGLFTQRFGKQLEVKAGYHYIAFKSATPFTTNYTGTVTKLATKAIGESYELDEQTLILAFHAAADQSGVTLLEQTDTLQITAQFTGAFANVQNGVSGGSLLVQNGQKTDILNNDFNNAVAARTAVGVKADGTLLHVVVDGKQAGYSDGMSVFELTDYLISLGAITALNMDGGGSSQLVTRKMNDSSKGETRNRGSDGSDRKVANALVLVDTSFAAQSKAVQHLAGRTTHHKLATQASVPIMVSGLNERFIPVPFENEVNFSPTLGQMQQQTYTAQQVGKETLHFTDVTNPTIQGALVLDVVDQFSLFQFKNAKLAAMPGESYPLDLVVEHHFDPVAFDPSQLSYQLSEHIGTIDEHHRLHISATTGRAIITVTYQQQQATIEVIVGKEPVIIEDFESGSDHWTSSGARALEVKHEISTLPEPVRFGQKALKLAWKWVGGPSGTAGAYAYNKGRNVSIPDYPKEIGMWVYADASSQGHLLRSQLADGTGTKFAIDFSQSIDWLGWKYVSAPVPSGKALPLRFDLEVRVLQTQNDKKTDGAIYVDQIRAVYGATNDDVVNPTVKITAPENEAIVRTQTPTIYFTAQDDQVIDQSKALVYLDGMYDAQATKTLQYDVNNQGEITFDSPLLDGLHEVKIVVFDHFGNQGTAQCVFEVITSSGHFFSEHTEISEIGSSFHYRVMAENMGTSEEATFQFIVDQQFQPQIHVDPKYQPYQRTEHYDQQTGMYRVTFTNLPAISGQLFEIQLKIATSVRQDERLKIQQIFGQIARNGVQSSFTLRGVDQPIDAPYELEVLRFTRNIPLEFQVRDREGNAISNALVELITPKTFVRLKDPLTGVRSDGTTVVIAKDETIEILPSEPSTIKVGYQTETLTADATKIDRTEQYQFQVLGSTDENGVLTSHIPTNYLTNYTMIASRDGRYSHNVTLQLRDIKGSFDAADPLMTLGATENSRQLTWKTNAFVSQSYVEIKRSDQSWDQAWKIDAQGERVTLVGNEYQQFLAKITDLVPGTTYDYRLKTIHPRTKASDLSTTYTFSLPSDQTKTTFALFGDTQAALGLHEQGGYGDYQKLFRQAASEQIDFALHVGDMVDDGGQYRHWELTQQALSNMPNNHSIPLMSAVGNHEVIGNGLEVYNKTFYNPPNGPDNFKNSVYSFDYHNIHLAVLNTEVTEQQLQQQLQWLKQDMQESRKTWKFIMLHRPPYASNSDSGNRTVARLLPSVIDELAIDIVFSGHDHAYVRSQPLRNNAIEQKGSTYILAGSTGPKFYGVTPQFWMDKVYAEHTQVYTTLTIENDHLALKVQNIAGEVVDTHELNKEPITEPDNLQLMTKTTKVAYQLGSAISEEQFLQDVGVSTNIPAGLTTNLTQQVNWQQIGTYFVTIQATQRLESVSLTPTAKAANQRMITVQIIDEPIQEVSMGGQVLTETGQYYRELVLVAIVLISMSLTMLYYRRRT